MQQVKTFWLQESTPQQNCSTLFPSTATGIPVTSSRIPGISILPIFCLLYGSCNDVFLCLLSLSIVVLFRKKGPTCPNWGEGEGLGLAKWANIRTNFSCVLMFFPSLRLCLCPFLFVFVCVLLSPASSLLASSKRSPSLASTRKTKPWKQT